MSDLDRIRASVLNPIAPKAGGAKRLAGVIGAAPSHYSKSPQLWNAAFTDLDIEALYLPFDLNEGGIDGFLRAVRESPSFLGCNVTVPHKLAVVQHLDTLDESARRIGAVNTIVRTPSGELAGANTDGAGFIETLVTAAPGEVSSLFANLDAVNVLILGAGGSARAIAFALAEKLGKRELLIANRSYASATALASAVAAYHSNTKALGEREVAAAAARARLIVNCTTKGQGEIARGEGASLEPFSALAPAGAAEAIEENHRVSLEIARSIPADAVFYDLIYHPEETVFLRHGRETGHRAVNGRGMIVAQAVEAFFNHICRRELEAKQMRTPETRRRLRNIMARAWTAPRDQKF
jgi:shikimate dehydrogenase